MLPRTFLKGLRRRFRPAQDRRRAGAAAGADRLARHQPAARGADGHEVPQLQRAAAEQFGKQFSGATALPAAADDDRLQEETWGLKTLCGENGDESDPHDMRHGQDPNWCANNVWNASADCNPISVEAWLEQRRYGITYPAEALGTHPLSSYVKRELDALHKGSVTVPVDIHGTPMPVAKARSMKCGATGSIGFDSTTGALTGLNGKDLGELFKLEYSALSGADVMAIAHGYNDYGGGEYFGTYGYF